jgi:hypothetical protein
MGTVQVIATLYQARILALTRRDTSGPSDTDAHNFSYDHADDKWNRLMDAFSCRPTLRNHAPSLPDCR